MFIDITKLEIKENIPVPLYIHKELVKRFMGENPKEEFTPEIMIEYLKHTNIVANVRDMLELIPEGKEAEFKEAVLSAVERRNVAPINIPRIREIAERGGFLEDFKETHKLEKWVPHTAQNHRVFIAKSNEDLRANPDLSGYGTVICDFEGKTEFADLTKLPKKMIIKGDIDWNRRFSECYDEDDPFNASLIKYPELPDISESMVYGYFSCSNNPIKTLKGAPKVVKGNLLCRETYITSFEDGPKKVGKNIYCPGCENLDSIAGLPEYGGSIEFKYPYFEQIYDSRKCEVTNRLRKLFCGDLNKSTLPFNKQGNNVR